MAPHPTRLLLSVTSWTLGVALLAAVASADPGPTDEPHAHDARAREPQTEQPASAPPAPSAADAEPTDDAASDLDLAHEEEPELEARPGRRGASRGTRPRRAMRWSDGPRRVPTPRGASKARAEELGLGTRECASRLLHAAPDEAWTRAARGREPGRLLWPIDEGRWVRGFGYVRTTRPDLIHRGVDISAPVGTVVRAAADGIVAYSDNGIHGYGNLVMIVHRNGWVTLYAHNARTTVQPGYRVRRGERIAIVGTTGITHGPHVHFELWQGGRAVDPSALFDGGPAYVERLGERAARRGDVPPPREVTAADRPMEAALAPHPDDVARPSRRARGRS